MSTTFDEPMNLGDLLKYEAPNLYSRDIVTVVLGQNLALGAVVGRVTASGKVKVIDPSASDGSEVAVGVLIQACDATTTDQTGLMLARHALVSDAALVLPTGLTANEQAAILDQLKTLGIVPRAGV